MHKEKIVYGGKEIEVETFDTVVHMTRGTTHALRDIGRLLKEEKRLKKEGGRKVKNYDWKEIKRKEHKPRLIYGTYWPEETILEKAVGASVYKITYHLCNGIPSGSQRFKTRWEAELVFDSV